MTKINLKDLLKTFKEGNKKKLTIDGVEENHNTYLIPIDYLYFNDLNGRIATYVEEYNDNNPNNLIDLLNIDKEEYNNIIAKFIKNSADDSQASFNKTKEDIREKTQQVAGVVLSDGRVIDGNRRFTAIRELFNETGNSRFRYFEAVCLDAPDKNDATGWRRIKELELRLQFNVDDKKDYNRIEYLVNFYKTIEEGPNKFSKQQYCHAAGIKSSKYEKDYRTVKVMLDYLERLEKPKCFYIIKQNKLDGPLEEIAGKIKDLNSTEWNSNKFYIYAYITFVRKGDRTRDVRILLDSIANNTSLYNDYSKSFSPEFNNKIMEGVAALNNEPDSTEETKRVELLCEEIQQKMIEALDDTNYTEKIKTLKNKPVDLLSKIYTNLSKIEIPVVKNLNATEKNKLTEILNDIRIYIDKIDSACNDEDT